MNSTLTLPAPAWIFRKKYLLEHVIVPSILRWVQHLEEQWILAYTLPDGKEGRAVLTETEWEDLVETEVEGSMQLDEILGNVPFTEISAPEPAQECDKQLLEAMTSATHAHGHQVHETISFRQELASPDKTKVLDKPIVPPELAAQVTQLLKELPPEPFTVVTSYPAETPEEVFMLPTLRELAQQVTCEATPEASLLLEKPISELYLVQHGKDGATLIATIVERGLIDIPYWRAPFGSSSNDEYRGDVRWITLKPQLVLDTAIGFFAGRIVGGVLSYLNGSEEADCKPLVRFLQVEMGNQFTYETVLNLYADEQERLPRLVRDRLELPLRLLRQVQACARMEIPPGRRSEALALQDMAKRVHWELNVTSPSGYAFVASLLKGHQLLFNPKQTYLLKNLLSYTAKTTR
jgi:hypothetical protein